MVDVREVSFREGEEVDPMEFVRSLAEISGVNAKYHQRGENYDALTTNSNGRPCQIAFSIKSGYDEKTKVPIFHVHNGVVEISDEAIQKARKCLGLKLDQIC